MNCLAPLSSDGPEDTTSVTQTHVQTQPLKDVTVAVGRVTRSDNVGFMWGQITENYPVFGTGAIKHNNLNKLTMNAPSHLVGDSRKFISNCQ